MTPAAYFHEGDLVWVAADDTFHPGRVAYDIDGVVGIVSTRDPTMGWVLPRSCVQRAGNTCEPQLT